MGARWEPVGPKFSLKTQSGPSPRAGLSRGTKAYGGEPCTQAGACAVGRVAGRGDRVTEPLPSFSCRDPDRHVKVKQRGSVLNMLRRLDKIRFRGHRRDDFLDLAESPNASDTECGDEVPLKMPRASARDSEELRDTVSTPCGPGTPSTVRLRPRGPPRGAGGCPPLCGPAECALGIRVPTSVAPLCPRLAPHWTSLAIGRCLASRSRIAQPLPWVHLAAGFLFLPRRLPRWLADFSWGSHAQKAGPCGRSVGASRGSKCPLSSSAGRRGCSGNWAWVGSALRILSSSARSGAGARWALARGDRGAHCHGRSCPMFPFVGEEAQSRPARCGWRGSVVRWFPL